MLVLPAFGQGGAPVSVDRMVRAILERDQFDDWVPDVAYHQDVWRELEAAVAAIEERLTRGRLPDPEVETIDLPRRSGQSTPAILLPLGARALLHAVIAAMAPRISGALSRDKVYGSAFRPHGAFPFDAPGAELSEMLAAVSEASGERPVAEILDVAGFDRSATLDALAETLQACGARGDECAFLRALLGLAGRQLPAGDDAVSFLYNFYLQPVDAALLKAKKNFFRHGDEYVVFEEETRAALHDRMRAAGLVARVIARLADHRKKSEERAPADDRDGREMAQVRNAIGGPPASVADLFLLDPDSRPLDAMRIASHLRSAHRQRCDGALAMPPFAGESEALAAYRKQIGAERGWLRRALRAAIREHSSWQAAWTAMLLSDVGTLDEQETSLLFEILESPEMHGLAKLQARITLARCTAAPPSAFWGSAEPEAAQSEQRRRGLLVAARFLSRRIHAPDRSRWEKLRERFAGTERRLIGYLEGAVA